QTTEDRRQRTESKTDQRRECPAHGRASSGQIAGQKLYLTSVVRPLSSAYAASSSTSASLPPSALGPRRGPLASAASISLIASVSVMRWTAEISRASRSRAAS